MSSIREENKNLKNQLETYKRASEILYSKAHENMSLMYYFVREVYPKLSKDEAERVCKEYNISNETIQEIANALKNVQKTNDNKEKPQTEELETKDGTKDDDVDPNYKVGYKNPPKKTRFQKGNKGNPKGRKSKKGIPVKDLLLNDLDSKATIVENGKKKKVYKREIISKTLLKQMLNGEPISRNNIKLINELDKYLTNKGIIERVFNAKLK